MRPTSNSPPEPRLAATVLLVRDNPFRVLMMRRPESRRDAYASSLVFPAGVVEPTDWEAARRRHESSAAALSSESLAVRLAAVREVFEETGLLIAHADGGAPSPGPELFQRLEQAGPAPRLDRLISFAHWITPELAPRRFDTYFFLCRIGSDATLCRGLEAETLDWVEPTVTLERAGAGVAHLPFPTRMNLKRLAESPDVETAERSARLRTPFTVFPQVVDGQEGRMVQIPAEAGYGVTLGRP